MGDGNYSSKFKSIKSFIIRLYCCFFGIFLLSYSVIVITCASLYYSNPPNQDIVLNIVQGDSVLVNGYQEHWYDAFIKQSLTIISPEDDVTSEADPFSVYESACKDLSDHVTANSSISHISVPDCVGRCEIDSFLYFINSPLSVLTYNFNQQQIDEAARLLLFDDYSEFTSFLDGTTNTSLEIGEPINNSITFEFSQRTQPSYYFVSLENKNITISNTPALNVTRQMTQVLYDISTLHQTSCTFCKLIVYKSYRASKKCFILHASNTTVNETADFPPPILSVDVDVRPDSSTAATMIFVFSGFYGALIPSSCFCCLVVFIRVGCCRSVFSRDKKVKNKGRRVFFKDHRVIKSGAVRSRGWRTKSSYALNLRSKSSSCDSGLELIHIQVGSQERLQYNTIYSKSEMITSPIASGNLVAISTTTGESRSILSQTVTDTNIDEETTSAQLQDITCNLTNKQSWINQLPPYETIDFDEEGLFHHSRKYGITVIIPRGAVTGAALLQFGATMLLKGFQCEPTMTSSVRVPVSPIVWIHTHPKLSKPAELYIPHHVLINTSMEDNLQLRLYIRGDDCRFFKVWNNLEQIQVNISDTLLRATATHFCSLCLMAESVPKMRYHLVYAKKELDGGTYHCDVCVLYSFKCLQTFRDSHKGYEIFQNPVSFMFEEFRLKVELPANCGWDYALREFELDCIKKEQLDFYQFLNTTPETVSDEDKEALAYYEEKGLYPPSFKISFNPVPHQSKNCQVKILLVADGNRTITIPIELQGELPACTSSNSIDSGYSNSLRLVGSMSNDSVFNNADADHDDMAAFFIDALTFLESKITSTDYAKFGHHLGLTTNDLHMIEVNVGHDTRRCVRQILFQWRKQSSPDSVCPETISKALDSSGYHLLSKLITSQFTSTKTFCKICQTHHGGNNMTSLDSSVDHLLKSNSNYDPEIFEGEPDVSNLMNLVAAQIPDKWELVGSQLQIEQSILNAIKRTNLGDCQLCFQHLFDEWRKTRSCPYTWLTVIKVLHSPSVKEYMLAEKIYKHVTICGTA